MRSLWILALLALTAVGCVIGHLTKDIPPPGGCDQCHRQKIGGDWSLAIAPVQLGEQGGIPEDKDIVMRQLLQVPSHREVPAKRLEVFAAAAPPETVGEAERGIQCFICHRSPGPPHGELRGRFDHPWGKTEQSGE